ncbi:MAG: hypothetical protein H7Z40_14555 [Phycisphaerae bacterium]|nr:hypothetical protein [Gemmatimonadaceae bacterium]
MLTDGVITSDANRDVRALSIGAEQFLQPAARTVLRNTSATPAQLLRIDFLTAPLAR